MKILHILNHTGRQNGNVHAAVDLAAAQAALGHDVAVCSRGGDFSDVFAAAGVETFWVDARRLQRLPQSLAHFARLCRDWRPDVVHAHMAASALLAWPVTRALGLPLVATAHNAFERGAIAMGVADRVIAVSRLAGVAMLRRGLSQSRIRVVLNGTIGSARQTQPPPPPAELAHPAIVFVGGLHPRKGIDVLLHAMCRVREFNPVAHLYLVGEGPMQSEYEALARELRLEDWTHFVGAVADPRPYMAASDIFVLPSRADPAPLVLSEARQLGCAIIASEVDGIAEMLDHGAAGVLTPPGDPERLALAIRALLDDPALRVKLGRGAALGLGRFAIERVAKDTHTVYREAIELRARAAPRPERRVKIEI